MLTPAPGKSEKSVTVSIPPGSSVRQIAGILDEAGLVKEDIRFLIIAKVSGLAAKLPAGEFALPTGRKPLELLRDLAAAKPVLHSVTIPEGWNRFEIAAAMEDNGWCSRDEFLQLTEDPKFIERFGFGDLTSLEGYLFPDTYFMTRSEFQAEKIIAVMVNRFQKIWKEIVPAGTAGVDRNRTVILASIVEKETGASTERAKIAGVFVNRLRTGMKLQSDPTVIYGVENFSGPITKKQLQTSTPYNTYVIPGLPQGPICSPGRESLLAVLQPEDHKFFYFVSQNDGTHYFSRSLKEHNRAVRKYQRKKSAKEGK